MPWQNDLYKDLPQSAGFTHTLNFYMDSAVATPPKPAKLLIDKRTALHNDGAEHARRSDMH